MLKTNYKKILNKLREWNMCRKQKERKLGYIVIMLGIFLVINVFIRNEILEEMYIALATMVVIYKFYPEIREKMIDYTIEEKLNRCIIYDTLIITENSRLEEKKYKNYVLNYKWLVKI
jgi:hypothetical protein